MAPDNNLGTVIITGVSGLVGGRIAAYLVKQGHKVIGTTRNPDGAHVDAITGATGAVITDLDTVLADVHTCGPTAIIHCAGPAAAACADDPEAAINHRVEMMRRLITASAQTGAKLCVLSTANLYAPPLHGAVGVTAPIDDTQSAYAASHNAAERLLCDAAANLPIAPLILRLGNLYGAPVSAMADCWHLLAQHACRSAMETGSVHLRDAGTSYRSYTPIAALETVLPAILAPKEGGSCTISNFAPAAPIFAGKLVAEIQAIMESVYDKKIQLNFDPSTIDDGAAPFWYGDNLEHDAPHAVNNLAALHAFELRNLLAFCHNNYRVTVT